MMFNVPNKDGEKVPDRESASTAVQKSWKYFWAKKNKQIDDHADPTVQLQQAIGHAQDESVALRNNVAGVIGQQHQAEMRLNELHQQHDKLTADIQAAITLIDKTTDPAKKDQLQKQAELLANQLAQLNDDIKTQSDFTVQATQAAEKAKEAVADNERQMQDALNEQHRLLAQEQQAKAMDSLNAVTATLNSPIGDGVTSTLAEVRERIEAHGAKAMGMAELNDGGAVGAQRAIEAASSELRGASLLDQMRAQMGSGGSSDSTPSLATAAETTEPSPAPAPSADQPKAPAYDPNSI